MTIKVKVLHILPNYFPHLGGIETLMYQYFKMQKDDSKYEHAILTLKRNNQSSAERTPGVSHLDEIDMSDFQDFQDTLQPTLRVISKLRKVISEQNPSIIHVHGILELSVFAAKIGRELGIPVIFHFHGSVTIENMKVLNPILPFIQNVLAVSQATRLSLLPYFSSDIQIKLLVNGVEDVGGKPVTNSQSAEPKLLIAGRIEQEKGFDVAIKAFGIILKKIPSIRLLVIGTGSQLNYLQTLSNDLGISMSIDFLGAQKNEEVISLIDQSILVLVPSREIEGFGIVAIEAALREVVVIASDIGGLSHTIENGKSGFLVKAEDPIALAEKVMELLQDPFSLKLIGKYARIRALRQFSMIEFRTKLEDYYLSIQNGR
jgi:glycosyltransferase involved in cell wall biosynthesis